MSHASSRTGRRIQDHRSPGAPPGARDGGHDESLERARLLSASLFSSPASLLISNLVGTAVLFFSWHTSGHRGFLALALAASGVLVLRAWTIRRYLGVSYEADRRLEVCNTRHLGLYVPDGAGAANGPADLHALVERAVGAGRLAAEAGRAMEAGARAAITHGAPRALEIPANGGETLDILLEPTPDGGVVVVTEDVTACKRIIGTIERMANTDGLTGLLNRHAFNRRLAEAAREGTEGFALLSIDLDDFKTVNDSLGHGVGDELLVQVAARLTRDVPPGSAVARLGGDEFMVLLRGSEADRALATGTALLDAFREPFAVNGRILHLTSSIGVASERDAARSPAEILSAVDLALYAAKAAGRNTASRFSPGMAEEARRRQELEEDLRTAWAEGRFDVHYQPIVELASGRVRACEALLRWHHPARGFVPPAEFVPVAERIGLIRPLGEMVLARACADASRWPGDVAVAVNVSPLQLRRPACFASAVEERLAAHGLDPSRLELEVTESVLIDNPEQALQAMRQLRARGVRLALDDFGTGYSSLGYLARFPFSKVKIDRSFAELVASDETSRAVIEVVCQLARRLDLGVVVEGIETAEQAREVRRLGADQAQGFLFARPGPAGALDFSPRAPTR